MALTNQRVIPIVLVVVALGLVAARVVVSLTKRAPSKGSGVQWLTPEEGLRLAANSDKLILLDFTAEWCRPCHMLDAEVFQNPVVAKNINQRFIPIRVVDRKREEGRNTPEVDALQQQYGVRGYPTVVLADRSGERARMEGFGGREEFEQMMESVR
jgi:thiol:disulfide interchange protein